MDKRRETTLRPARVEDRDLLLRIYSSTREEELEVVPWSAEQKQAFVEFQFQAQDTYYRQTFPEARFDVVELNAEPIGRLYVDRRPDEIRIIDIALLPSYRGRSIGGDLMHELLREASDRNLPVRIHVENENRARRLYRRLGFRTIENQGVYRLLEWRPPGLEGEQGHA